MIASDPQLAVGKMVLGDICIESAIAVRGVGGLYRGRASSAVLVRAMTSETLVHAAQGFAREVSVVRHVEHAGVVAPVNSGVEGSDAFVAYESTDGTVLQQILGVALPLSEIARIVAEVAEILDYAHRQPAPMLHAALTPSSVLLCGNRRTVRLLDLGLVQALERENALPAGLWDLLDPSSVPPELVTRTFPLAATTDVFGLASLAFECLTGRPAFPAANAAEVNALILSGPRPSAHDIRRDVHADIDKILARAWSVDPRARPLGVLELAKELAGVLLRPIGRALGEQPTGPTMPGTSVAGIAIYEEDANTVIRDPKATDEDEEPTAIQDKPQNVPRMQRAHTLPFGIKAALSSEPPPKDDRPTVSRIAAVAALEVAVNRPAPVVPPPLVSEAAPPPAPFVLPDDVQIVRVVSVSGVIIALILAGGMIAGGALLGSGMLLARRAPVETSAPVASPLPGPPSSAPHPVVPTPPVASAAPVVTAPTVTMVSEVWPELPKQPGARPTQKALDAMRDRLKVAFEPCLKIKPSAPAGIPWMVHFDLDAASGRPTVAEVSKPFRGTVAGACMQRAALEARVPPFDGKSWSIDLKFGP